MLTSLNDLSQSLICPFVELILYRFQMYHIGYFPRYHRKHKGMPTFSETELILIMYLNINWVILCDSFALRYKRSATVLRFLETVLLSQQVARIILACDFSSVPPRNKAVFLERRIVKGTLRQHLTSVQDSSDLHEWLYVYMQILYQKHSYDISSFICPAFFKNMFFKLDLLLVAVF